MVGSRWPKGTGALRHPYPSFRLVWSLAPRLAGHRPCRYLWFRPSSDRALDGRSSRSRDTPASGHPSSNASKTNVPSRWMISPLSSRRESSLISTITSPRFTRARPQQRHPYTWESTPTRNMRKVPASRASTHRKMETATIEEAPTLTAQRARPTETTPEATT